MTDQLLACDQIGRICWTFQTETDSQFDWTGSHRMLQAFVITLREGLEAFLIIGISLAYLRKSGRGELISAVHWGIGLSILLSVGAAYLFQKAANQSLW